MEARVGVSFLKVGSQLGDAFIPHIIGTLGSAPKDMGGVFRESTPRASVVVLVFPCDEGLAHATIGGSMFSDPTPAGRLQSLHAGGTGLPIDRQPGIEGESLMPDPIELGDWILDGFVQAFSGRGGQLEIAAPHGPTLIVNRDLGSFHGGQEGPEVAVEQFGSGVHLAVQDSESPVGIPDFPVLVAVDMDWVPGDGRILDRGPHSLHEVQVFVLGVGQVIRFEWPKGVDVVTGHSDGAVGNIVLGTDGVDTQNSGVVSS